MHNFRVYWISLYMFRTVFSSIIRSSRLYTQHQVDVIQVSWLLASGHEMELQFQLVPASKKSAVSVWHISDAVCTVLDSWWWTERLSKTCRVIFNKLENCASSWFYCRKKNHKQVIEESWELRSFELFAGGSGNCLPTFWDSLLFSSLRVGKELPQFAA
jgi:hypothetical protein